MKKFKIFGIIFTLIIIGTFMGCDDAVNVAVQDSGAEGGRSNTDLGMDALENLDYSTAAVYFDAADKAGEDPELVNRGKGMAYLGLGRYKEAENAFENALAQSDGRIRKLEYDISYYLAVAQMKAGDYDDAYGTYSAIIALDEKASDAYFLRGKVNLNRGNKAEACHDFDRAVILEPTNYDFYIQICKELIKAGYEEDGKAYIQRAMNTDSKKSDYQTGVFQFYMGDYEGARTSFENARSNSKDKDTQDLILYLGRTYEALGDLNYTSTLYSTYLSEHSDSAALYLQLGLIRMQLMDYDGALSAFEAGISLGTSDYIQSLKFNQIVAYEYKLDFIKARDLMKGYLLQYPDDETAEREYEFLSTR